jgi:hypothetical protein
MADDDLLARISNAVQGVQSAFQNLCSDYKSIHTIDAEDRDLLALGPSLQGLGSIVEILNGLDAADVDMEHVRSILVAPSVVSTSGYHMPMVNAMIADMHILKGRLIDVRNDITTSQSGVSATSSQIFPPGEAMNARQMIEKYHSIITEISRSQNLCVIHCQRGYLYSHCQGIRPIP